MPRDPSYQAFRFLQIAFVIVPLVAGLDKFFYLLDNWSKYLSPLAMKMLGTHDRGFMMIVGAIEVIAGLGVVFKPKVFSYVVFVWLCAIIINLFFAGQYDIALRDFGLAMGALSLGRLSQKYSVTE